MTEQLDDPGPGRGGARSNAGRKAGGENKRTSLAEADRERILSEGKSPLDVMIDNMRAAETEAEKIAAEVADMRAKLSADGATPEMVKALAELHRAAASYASVSMDCAKNAAPYLHPKLANVDRSVGVKLPEIKTPADLEPAQAAIFAALEAKEITLDESVKLSNIIEARRKAFEAGELAARIAALEQQNQGKGVA